MGLNRYKARVSGRVMWEEFVWPSVDRPPVDWPQAEERLGWAWAPWIFIYQVWYNQKMVNCFSALLHSHYTPSLPLSFSTLLQLCSKFAICIFSHLSFNYQKVKVCFGKFVIIGDQKLMMNLTQFETKSGAKHSRQWQWNTILKIMNLI